MSIINNEHIDSEDTIKLRHDPEDTIKLQHVTVTPRMLKKMRLEQSTLSATASGMMRAIRRSRVDLLPEYFEQTCDWRPHHTAIICGSSRLTYQELDRRANRLAHFLISQGIGKDDPVGILLDRSLDTYVAVLGVLKAGAAFVPLDRSFPPELVTFIAEDAGMRGIVTTYAFREKTTSLPCPVLELDLAYEALSVQQETRPQVRIDPASLCYIMYTLGTTGRPKGVAVSHTNIVSFLRVATPIYNVKHNDRVYQGISIAFDLSLAEIWPAWIAGATLIAGPTDFRRFGHGLTEFLIEHKITVLCCVPTQLATIERDVPSLHSLFISGEACPAYLVSRWARPGRRMLNTYGPAETTVMATWSELFPNRPVTIGTPLPTYQIYILDNQLRAVKEGESGEIYIGGPGVAIGYYNRPARTNERFIPNPIAQDRGIVPRLYRTGNLGRITRAGEIEYLGQVDTGIKLNGYYIKNGEIEQLTHPQASFSGYTSAIPFETRVTSELQVEVSTLRMPKRINIQAFYNNVTTDPLYRNSLFTMASTLILGGLGFVFWIIIARLYNTESVGIATTLISIMTLLSSFTIMGLNVSLNRYLPKSAHKSELINSSFVIVTLAALLTSAIFLLRVQSFSPQLVFLQSNFFYIISFMIFIVFCSWNTLVESIFMAFRAAGNILIKNGIISILKLMLPFLLIVFGAYGIFASTAASLAIGVLTGLIIIILRFKIRPSISVAVPLIKETWTYSFANYMTSFMFNMPSLVLPVIILNVLSAKYVAYYYVASMLQNILLIIPLATSQSLLTEGSYNEAELKKHVKKAITTILIILIPATAVVVFGGNILLQLFGKTYAAESFQFLQIYSTSTLLTAVILVCNAIMNVKRQIKSLIISNILAAAFTLGLSYAFISGKLVGIGWGWILGQAIAGLISLLFIIRNSYVYNRAR